MPDLVIKFLIGGVILFLLVRAGMAFRRRPSSPPSEKEDEDADNRRRWGPGRDPNQPESETERVLRLKEEKKRLDETIHPPQKDD